MSGADRRRVLPAVCCAALALAGCNISVAATADSAGCRDVERGNNPVLTLMAQSVPTASQIPCISAIPAGWAQGPLSVSSGRSSFVLGSNRDGDTALKVTLTRTCRTAGATPVPTDQFGARRYERPSRVSTGYAGERYYVYPGGCTTYRFNLNGPTRAVGMSEVAGAVRLVSRTSIAEMVRRANHGRVGLDPAAIGKRR